MSPHMEARLASLLAAGGVIWTANLATQHFTAFDNLVLPSGPLELCAIAILIWLHAKWRGSLMR